MSDAWKDWDRIAYRLQEMHPDWVIYAISFDPDDEKFTVVCKHGAEFVSQYALPKPRNEDFTDVPKGE